ncbi:multiple epidermal growth factor-like domains protein 10, partial [Pecten maximus]|uniref:multiple epidermal growth factor-like domains protein 10 n=1 Tax=Pecten maximus TaxID=6579 RepID=UPI00145868A2
MTHGMGAILIEHTYSCAVGFYNVGDYCIPCPGNCAGGTCNSRTGACSECDDTFYGTHCNQSCPDNCKTNICDMVNGRCTDCADGFHGNFCIESCPENCLKTCAMLDGQCEETKAMTSGSDSQTAIFAGTGVGVMVIVAGIVVFVKM